MRDNQDGAYAWANASPDELMARHRLLNMRIAGVHQQLAAVLEDMANAGGVSRAMADRSISFHKRQARHYMIAAQQDLHWVSECPEDGQTRPDSGQEAPTCAYCGEDTDGQWFGDAAGIMHWCGSDACRELHWASRREVPR